MDNDLEKNIEETRKYELDFITTSEDFSPVKAIIAKNKGTILAEKPAQKIVLSYPMKKQIQGFMGTIECVLHPDNLNQMNKDLILADSVLRFMISKFNEKISLSKRERFPESNGKLPGNGEELIKIKKQPTNYEVKKSFDYALTNEAIEKKIEEMLQ